MGLGTPKVHLFNLLPLLLGTGSLGALSLEGHLPDSPAAISGLKTRPVSKPAAGIGHSSRDTSWKGSCSLTKGDFVSHLARRRQFLFLRACYTQCGIRPGKAQTLQCKRAALTTFMDSQCPYPTLGEPWPGGRNGDRGQIRKRATKWSRVLTGISRCSCAL